MWRTARNLNLFFGFLFYYFIIIFPFAHRRKIEPSVIHLVPRSSHLVSVRFSRQGTPARDIGLGQRALSCSAIAVLFTP
jgi:hypothetical protein